MDGLKFAQLVQLLERNFEDLHRVVAPLGEEDIWVLAREVVVGAVMLKLEVNLVDCHASRRE